jgi:hypothetical protein
MKVLTMKSWLCFRNFVSDVGVEFANLQMASKGHWQKKTLKHCS